MLGYWGFATIGSNKYILLGNRMAIGPSSDIDPFIGKQVAYLDSSARFHVLCFLQSLFDSVGRH